MRRNSTTFEMQGLNSNCDLQFTQRLQRRCPRNLRTTDGQPVCNCCLRVGHVAKYCRNRRYVLPPDQIEKHNIHKFNAVWASQEQIPQVEQSPQVEEALHVKSTDLVKVSKIGIQSQEPPYLLGSTIEEVDFLTLVGKEINRLRNIAADLEKLMSQSWRESEDKKMDASEEVGDYLERDLVTRAIVGVTQKLIGIVSTQVNKDPFVMSQDTRQQTFDESGDIVLQKIKAMNADFVT